MDRRNTAIIERYFPGYRSPKATYQAMLDETVRADTVWLDIGCGKRICADDDLNIALPRRLHLGHRIDGR